MEINNINLNTYSEGKVVKRYQESYGLLPQEQVILTEYEQFIRDQAVLDIGCGAGRTAPGLSSFTQNYIGIDYAKPMVDACQQKYPNLRFLHADATNMPMFEDNSFNFVLFSFNGLDSISHEHRIQALREIYRILKPMGVFAFSSHNLDDKKRISPWEIGEFSFINIGRVLVNIVRSLILHLKVRKHQIRTANYAILSDPLDGRGHLDYFITKQNQVKQLEEIGFQDIKILDRNTQFVDAQTPDQYSHWLYYICRKPI